MAENQAPENQQPEIKTQLENSNDTKVEGTSVEESPIEEMRRLTAEMKKSKEIIEATTKKLEKIQAEQMIAGHSRQTPPQKKLTEEEAWALNAKKRYEGTGMDPT